MYLNTEPTFVRVFNGSILQEADMCLMLADLQLAGVTDVDELAKRGVYQQLLDGGLITVDGQHFVCEPHDDLLQLATEAQFAVDDTVPPMTGGELDNLIGDWSAYE